MYFQAVFGASLSFYWLNSITLFEQVFLYHFYKSNLKQVQQKLLLPGITTFSFLLAYGFILFPSAQWLLRFDGKNESLLPMYQDARSAPRNQ